MAVRGRFAGRNRQGRSFRRPATGFTDAQYLVVERKDISGQTENHAVSTFAQSRRGVASWLAAPAPIRALDYVSRARRSLPPPSSRARMHCSTTLSPWPGRPTVLADFEAATGVNLREDLARTLGGEFAFAVDGPLLPMPSWKLVLEVYDPSRVQETLDKLALVQTSLLHRSKSPGKTPTAGRFTRCPAPRRDSRRNSSTIPAS